MNNRTLNHLHSENKRLNELVVQIVSECNDRVNFARSNEVLDLQAQLAALRAQNVQLKNENENLKSNDKKDNINNINNNINNNNLQVPIQAGKEREERREQLLNKLQDVNSVLDGLSTQGTQLHKMVSALYHKNNTSITNNNINNTSQKTITPSNSPSPPLLFNSPSTSFSFNNPNNNSLLLNLPESDPTTNIYFPPTKPSNLDNNNTTSFINLPNIPSLPSENSIKVDDIVKERESKTIEDKIEPQQSVELESLNELMQLESLLSRSIPDLSVTVLDAGPISSSLEEELELLEKAFDDACAQATFTLDSYSSNRLSPPNIIKVPSFIVPSSSSIPPPPPPPPPIFLLVTPPPPPSLLTTAIQSNKKELKEVGRRETVNQKKEVGLLAAIQAVRPDSEARMELVSKFQKERKEKKKEAMEEGESGGGVSLMDRLMHALKRVKVDSSVRMAAITQVEQEVQTRSKTVRSDRLITDTMISQQKGLLKKTGERGGGIEALEEARRKRMEALKNQYREESLSLNHSYPIEGDTEMYRYTTSDEEEEEEDEDDEGGLASIFQGLIKTQTPDLGLTSASEEDEENYYYSDEEEDATVFESIGQMVHERFAANRNSMSISLEALKEAGI